MNNRKANDDYFTVTSYFSQLILSNEMSIHSKNEDKRNFFDLYLGSIHRGERKSDVYKHSAVQRKQFYAFTDTYENIRGNKTRLRSAETKKTGLFAADEFGKKCGVLRET